MEISSGLRSVLSNAKAYAVFNSIIGSTGGTRAFVDRYVRPVTGNRVLDIGCGPAAVLAYLGDVEYVGFDASAVYIDQASRAYGDRARFFCKRLTAEGLAEFDGFDIVLAQGVLHHLDDDEAVALFRLAERALVPGGRLVTIDGCYRAGQSAVARYLLQRDRGRNVRTEPEYLELAHHAFPVVKATIETSLLRIPYTHLIMEAEKPG